MSDADAVPANPDDAPDNEDVRRPDPDAPGNFVDDESTDDIPEPNEPA